MKFKNMLEDFIKKANNRIGHEGKVKSDVDLNSLMLDRIIYQKKGWFRKKELVRFHGTYGFKDCEINNRFRIPITLYDERLKNLLEECSKEHNVPMQYGVSSYTIQ